MSSDPLLSTSDPSREELPLTINNIESPNDTNISGER